MRKEAGLSMHGADIYQNQGGKKGKRQHAVSKNGDQGVTFGYLPRELAFHLLEQRQALQTPDSPAEPSATVGGKPIKAFSAMQDSVQLMTVAKFLMRNENAYILEL